MSQFGNYSVLEVMAHKKKLAIKDPLPYVLEDNEAELDKENLQLGEVGSLLSSQV